MKKILFVLIVLSLVVIGGISAYAENTYLDSTLIRAEAITEEGYNPKTQAFIKYFENSEGIEFKVGDLATPNEELVELMSVYMDENDQIRFVKLTASKNGEPVNIQENLFLKFAGKLGSGTISDVMGKNYRVYLIEDTSCEQLEVVDSGQYGVDVMSNRLGLFAIIYNQVSAGAEEALTISTAADFKAFADSVNSGDTYEGETITLANDIDISEICGKNINGEEISWTPIGDFDNPFNGTFDGNGHTVNGLYINSEYMDYAGLFGYCGEGSRISNLIVDGSVTVGFSSSDDETQALFEIGGIAALSFGEIVNCHNKASITGIGDGAFAGGICDHGALLENCINTGTVVSEGRAVAVAVSTKRSDNCYYLEDTAANGGTAIAKTAEQFASGEVAYLLGTPWGQRIGVDKYPVIGGDRVYLINDKYTNTPPEYPYTINLLKLVSASGEEYDEIPTDTSFIVDMDVTQVTERSGKDYFIVAAYDESNALVSMNYIKADLPTGAGFSCGVNIQKSDTPIASIKAFVWGALGTMTPLAESVEYKK